MGRRRTHSVWILESTCRFGHRLSSHVGSSRRSPGYIAKWITAYRRQHVKIWAVTVQNEPEHNAPWEACCYTAQEEADFVAKHLGPTLRNLDLAMSGDASFLFL